MSTSIRISKVAAHCGLLASTLGAVLLLGACDGSSGGGSGTAGLGSGSGSPVLTAVAYGRVVDIYAYRRIDPNKLGSTRADTGNRAPVLIDTDVVVDPNLESQELFDLTGQVRDNADYRFLPFDVNVGHEELLILWDDDPAGPEFGRFQNALARAQGGLIEVPSSFRGQDVNTRPIPVVPTNAALLLTFDRSLPIDSSFFLANPSALQLLEFRNDPNSVGPDAAFAPVPFRPIVSGNRIVIDTSLIGAEATAGASTAGLKPSADSVTANFRIAIPSGGGVSNDFRVSEDRIPELNGIDARGDTAVIRDFRSANSGDTSVVLSDVESPSIQAELEVGIIDVDPVAGTVTLNKRNRNVPIRGRIPFVDGGIRSSTGLPGGRPFVPTGDENSLPFPLPSGDVLVQEVTAPTGERFTLRAEVIANEAVGQIVGDPNQRLGLTSAGTDGGEVPVVVLRVPQDLGVFDSNGNPVWFQDGGGSAGPLGQEAEIRVRYYEHLEYLTNYGPGIVSDKDRRGEFLVFDPPQPTQDGTGAPVPIGGPRILIDPLASVTMSFSEPLALGSVGNIDNFLISTQDIDAGNLQTVLDSPKQATLSITGTRLVDVDGDSTSLQLVPPFGSFHEAGNNERYWLHLNLGDGGPKDFAGNSVEIYDRRRPDTVVVDGVSVEVPLLNFSVPFDLDPEAPENLVGTRIHRFESTDEDGTLPGTPDLFGNFRLINGELQAARTSRRSLTADENNLGTVSRFDGGVCLSNGDPDGGVLPADTAPPGGNDTGNGFLYLNPSLSLPLPNNALVNFGGILEPHTNRGSRLQMTYREDDFGLSQTAPTDLNLDVEQLHWAPFNDATVLFDEFDRYTIRLSHSDKRPDAAYEWQHLASDGATPPTQFFPFGIPNGQCFRNTLADNSGLSTFFADNVLRGEQQVTVVADRRYIINPADAFRAASGVKYVPYPKFERTFTWRDSRKIIWDQETQTATGFGGARDAVSSQPVGDHTASVSSPWVPEDINDLIRDAPYNSVGFRSGLPSGALPYTFTRLTRNPGDFFGDRTRDHDPIALPLLVDFLVFPDDGLVRDNASNLMHVAGVGGFYGSPPEFRVHTSGGIDPNSGTPLAIQPDRQFQAFGGIIRNEGIGLAPDFLVAVPPGDAHLPWAQIDLVRRVSLVTFGFFDTLQPNRHDLSIVRPRIDDLPPATGRPDLSTTGSFGPDDFIVLMDPPVGDQAGGTSVTLELRGAESIPGARTGATFDGPPQLYNATGNDRFDERGNLLNPNFACEAFRYSMRHPGVAFLGTPGDYDLEVPRPAANGLTPYVPESNLDSIRNSLGTLPRYMNYRFVMENNIDAEPAVSPTVRSLIIAYRVRRQ